MGRLAIVRPLPLAGVTSSRGTGAVNLLTPDPKEVWADDATGTATLVVDLGAAKTIDTIFLGYVSASAATASWAISGGIADPAETPILPAEPLRVPDGAGDAPPRTHALWTGTRRTLRYLAITLDQPAGSPPMTAGVIVVGQAFVAKLGQEWGAGRQPVDTGTATELPSGGFAVQEGTRKRSFKWTFGDLSVAEVDELEAIALALGETLAGLVIEDAARTPGLHARLHYGLFDRWAAYERRHRSQTRWEVGIRQWV